MIILCEHCKKEMTATKHSIYPGTNDTVYSIEPCCPSEDVRKILHDLEHTTLDEFQTVREYIIEILEELPEKVISDELVEDVAKDLKNIYEDLESMVPQSDP